MFNSIGIAGLGLLGGSVALAAKRKNLAEKIYGYTRSSETLNKAISLGVIDRSFSDFSSMVDSSDFVILSAPISVNVQLAKKITKIKPEILFTDVGSTKKTIATAVDRCFRCKHRFCGSHPIAGSEKRGIENANSHLFEGKIVILTPSKKSEGSAVRTIEIFWKNIGATVVKMKADRHDEICSYTSHFPHIAAFLLVEMLSKKFQIAQASPCIGPGFRDTTRIAASDQEIWTEIFIDNRKNLLKAIREFKRSLDDVERLIKSKDTESLKKWIEKIKKIRNKI